MSAIIRDFRLKNDMTQQELAEKLGYTSYVSVSYWENGKRDVPQTVINLIKEWDKHGL